MANPSTGQACHAQRHPLISPEITTHCMPPSNPPANPVPLCVDLDGTLIKTDLLWESLARLLRRNPFQLLPVLFWWMRGRAFLKRQLVKRVTVNPAALPYHQPFLAYLRAQKAAGRKLVLVTASDRAMALPVANHVGLFDEVLGSDGKTNLRGANKLKVLVAKFGERGFDYAGNSSVDYAVWRGAREAVVVNARPAVVRQAAECTKPGPVFVQDYSPLGTLKSFLNELLIRSGYLVAIGAGLLLTAAFPKIDIAGCAWVAPALLVAAAHGKRGGDAFRVGYVAGLVHFLSSLYWLLLIPVPGFPILGWVALCLYLAVYPAIWVWLVNRWGERTREPNHTSWSGRLFWSLTGAAAWVALETVRVRLFTGFPWNPLGASQYQLIPLIQIASVTGVYGVSFLVAWVSLSLFSAGRSIFQRPTARMAWQTEIFLPLAVIVALFAFGLARINGQNPTGATLRVTLVQPSIPQSLIWDPSASTNRFRQLLELSEQALKEAQQTNISLAPPSGERAGARGTSTTDLLIWPESAVPDLEFNFAVYSAITNFVRTHQVWLIFNAEDYVWRSGTGSNRDYDAFNAALLFNPLGQCAGVYHKQNLVIFGEYIPLVRWLPFIKWFTPITGSFASGTNAVTFELNWWGERTREPSDVTNAMETVGSPIVSPYRTVKTATLICFEDVFPDLARHYVSDDTDFLVNLTNDGWFGEGAAQWQQAAAAAFRAVENNVPLVRCCNNGLTCWVDVTGRLRDIFRDKTGSVYGMGATTIDLPLLPPGGKRTPTFYNQHGDWFGWACVGWTAFFLGMAVLRNRRKPV
jgi:apolipoprotein N-acyltransferase